MSHFLIEAIENKRKKRIVNKQKPTLMLIYSYREPYQYLKIVNTSEIILKSICITCLEKTDREYRMTLEEDDMMSGMVYVLKPGQSTEEQIGYYPRSFDYPEAPRTIKVHVAFSDGENDYEYDEVIPINSR